MPEQKPRSAKTPKSDAFAFGKILGLHPQFLLDVEMRGQDAIIDRAAMVDVTGGHGRILAMMQHVGKVMESRLLNPMDALETGDLVSALARQYGVDERLAVRLVGYGLETFQTAMRRMRQQTKIKGGQ